MPNNSPKRIYWDPNVFLSLIEKTPGRIQILEAILVQVRASGGSIELVTSAFSITEVAHGAEEQIGQPLNPTVEAQINELWSDPSVIKLRDMDRLVATDARRLIRAAMERGWSLKPKDAIHLATATALNVEEI